MVYFCTKEVNACFTGKSFLLVGGISIYSSPFSHCTFSHLLLSKGHSAEGEHTNASFLILIKPSVLF